MDATVIRDIHISWIDAKARYWARETEGPRGCAAKTRTRITGCAALQFGFSALHHGCNGPEGP